MMRLLSSRRTASVVSLSLGVCLAGLPGAASAADAGSSLTAAEMATAIRAAAAASASAMAEAGWKATVVWKNETGSFVYDDKRGQASMLRTGSKENVEWYGVDGKGEYAPIEPDDVPALRMMGRPGVTHVYRPASPGEFTSVVSINFPDPAFLIELEADTAAAGTRTVRGDGGADYAYTNTEGAEAAIHVDADGTVHAAELTAGDDVSRYAFAYGPQKVALPAAAVTITSAALRTGRIYLHMADEVEDAAKSSRWEALNAAKGKPVRVAALRKIVTKNVNLFNENNGGMLKTTSVTGGAGIHATNPWTRKTVTWTVTASGKNVVAARR
ncbi:hypothetical protein [Actinoplanes sp. NPDC049802]|uniref:hypothetical protein n=1 Tax=Actinoplanes sp. NPDC049802 TaxID=3154742 RepID=UPI0033FAE7AD